MPRCKRCLVRTHWTVRRPSADTWAGLAWVPDENPSRRLLCVYTPRTRSKLQASVQFLVGPGPGLHCWDGRHLTCWKVCPSSDERGQLRLRVQGNVWSPPGTGAEIRSEVASDLTGPLHPLPHCLVPRSACPHQYSKNRTDVYTEQRTTRNKVTRIKTWKYAPG